MPALICLSLPAAAEEDASQNLDLHRIMAPPDWARGMIPEKWAGVRRCEAAKGQRGRGSEGQRGRGAEGERRQSQKQLVAAPVTPQSPSAIVGCESFVI